MLETSYNMLFGKLALRCLLQDYFEQASHFSAKIMLKPIDDPHVDMIVTVEGPVDHRPEAGLAGNALFRWQRVPSSDYGFMGLRYGSENLSFGATVMPFLFSDSLPRSAWLVSKLGRLIVGLQYEPQSGSKNLHGYKNLANWSCAAGYGVGSGSPLCPSFNFSLELANSSQFIASFYQHVVVQRRVKNILEKDDVAAITNYIDFGFELQTMIEDAKEGSNVPDSTFQVAASWQANKNFLLKAKVGPHRETAALAFKSWWKPSVAFNISATRDRRTGKTEFGFSIRVEDIKKPSCQRAGPNYVMLTPNKEHAAEDASWKVGNRPVLQSENLQAGNFEGIPRELKPMT